ncbi:transposase [Caulobacter sp. BE254]|uniref:transposase n=1 Tax=Caulobacter sp. BE254 TaxID=2817720 RepID=UPI00285CF22F|nr:transposase [Caulobacter sp. BE254]MDR7116711.1 REP element-mobilizing transposase RayT [Caulobacter sp. BE254]
MPRLARVVIPGVPHHVTQRGTRRQPTFFRASDYEAYIRMAAGEFSAARVEVWAYCLMPNHVHLIATPETVEGLARAVGATHVRYARYINDREAGQDTFGKIGSRPFRWTRTICGFACAMSG